MIKFACRPRPRGPLGIFVAGLAFVFLFTGCAGGYRSAQPGGFASATTRHWGEYGGNMQYLASCCTGPQAPGESNYYLDMLGMGFPGFAAAEGLTNNHTLFVLSHGKAIRTDFGVEYAFYPGGYMVHPPCFSVRDLARILGPHALEIHNLVFAGCNLENMFDARDVKRFFVNATNIVHALPGTDATIGTFQEILTYSSTELGARSFMPSSRVPLFGRNDTVHNGRYVAELFRPGEGKPYEKVIAGRELLVAPSSAPALASKSSSAVAASVSQPSAVIGR